MEEIKGKNTEELLESLNSLLDKMPGLLKQAEELQISRRELEKENLEHTAEKKQVVLQAAPNPPEEKPAHKAIDEKKPVDTVINTKEENPVWNEYSMAGQNSDEDSKESEKQADEKPKPEEKKAISIPKGNPVLRNVPDGVPQSRCRRVMFLYTQDSSQLLETFLEDMYSYSLSSKENPFFVSRASVRKSDDAVAAEMFSSSTHDDISGIAYIGSLPEDVGNEFSSICRKEGIAFINVDGISYSKDLVLDFLIELIAIEKVDL